MPRLKRAEAHLLEMLKEGWEVVCPRRRYGFATARLRSTTRRIVPHAEQVDMHVVMAAVNAGRCWRRYVSGQVQVHLNRERRP